MKECFLLEIGTEELPHGAIASSSLQLAEKTAEFFNTQHIAYTKLISFSTPRRLAVLFEGVGTKQSDRFDLRKGPPLKAAFQNSQWTKAGEGFITSTGFPVPDSLQVPELPRISGNPETTDSALKKLSGAGKIRDGIYLKKEGGNEFLYAYKTLSGKDTIRVLEEGIPSLISSLEFPKVMRWHTCDFPFIRPIRWVCCMFGGKPVVFAIAGVTSSAYTSGHPQLCSRKKTILLRRADDYEAALKKNHVIACPEKRKKSILAQLKTIEQKNKIQILFKEKVCHVVVNLTEEPHALLCRFDSEFLRLPAELLASEMIEHQKYFPAADTNGKLTNAFIVTSNIKKKRHVIAGNVRVLTSRLRDASFLFEEDCKTGITQMGEKLKGVMLQKDLGSVADRVQRICRTLPHISGCFNVNTETAQLVCTLMKNDLVSATVYEFPELQGIIGMYLATHAGFSQEVSVAIREHYMPLAHNSPAPSSELGSLAALCDKFTTLLDCFSAGMQPKGSGDPYALRRHAVGIIKILIENRIEINLRQIIPDIAGSYTQFLGAGKTFDSVPSLSSAVLNFITTRTKSVFHEYNFSSDEIDAALSVQVLNIYAAFLVINAIHEFRTNPDFTSFITVYKRAYSITKDFSCTTVNTDLFTKTEETLLWDTFLAIKEECISAAADKAYTRMFSLYASLADPLDRFFKNVIVISENETEKNNRLALLKAITVLPASILDFNQIVV